MKHSDLCSCQELVYMGKLGKNEVYRCRGCGMTILKETEEDRYPSNIKL